LGRQPAVLAAALFPAGLEYLLVRCFINNLTLPGLPHEAGRAAVEVAFGAVPWAPMRAPSS
jgi:hypothetical protein